MSSRWFVAVLVGLLPAVSSCATMGNRPQSRSTGPVTLSVTDTNVQDVDVYVLADQFSMRMGTVSTAQTATFTVPDRAWQAIGGMQVIISPIGSSTGFISERILGVGPGSTVSFKVEPDLSMTWYQVR